MGRHLLLRVITLIALILPLGVDTLAISTSIGMAGISPKNRWRVSLAMTAFEALMPLVGLFAGFAIATGIGNSSRYIGAALLAAAGLYFIWESRREEREHPLTEGMGWPALALVGISVSMDELAVGFAGGLSRLPIVVLAILVGAQALLASQIGLRFGGAISEQYTELAERVGGVVLIGCAVLIGVHGF